MIRIGLDMMGGDFAPREAALGIAEFVAEKKLQAVLVLIGDEPAVRTELQDAGLSPEDFQYHHAPEVIGMHEHPTKALREKPNSSIAAGFGLLAKGEIDAFISAGNTGAMMVGALFSIKAIEGVIRPAIGAYLPRENGKLGLLVDVGLNADCKPENLNQFAVLGSLFAENILEIETPGVGLLNIGEEEGKGNLLAQSAYPLLKENKAVRFVGNMEGRDLLSHKADVIVCEGFTGNVALKMAESIHDIVARRNIKDEYFDRFNFESYGGVPVLGVSKPVIIGHGISRSEAFKNMIRIAVLMIEKDLTGKITEAMRNQGTASENHQ